MKWMTVSVFPFWLYCITVCWAYFTYRQPDLDCDFEGDSICGWEDAPYFAKWERKSGKATDYYDTGPSGDHTTGRGTYLLLATSRIRSRRTVRLTSPRIYTDYDACLSFWYMMHGFDVDTLSVLRMEATPKGHKMFTKFGPQGKRWYHAMINVPAGKYELSFEAKYTGYNGYGDIAIDDITYSYDGDCRYNATELMKDQPRFNCDFEDDLCSWYNFEDGASTWERKTLDTHSNDRNALPPNTNGYSYVEMTKKNYGETYSAVSLRGPTISVGEERACLTFWYKKFFIRTGRLSVIKHTYGHGKYGSGGEVLFTTSKPNAVAWQQVHVTLPQGDNYNIVFRVLGYHHYEGVAAVDDVTLTHDGPCPQVKNESKINCDFDSNFCSWYMTSSVDVPDWERGKGPTPSLYTGPYQDHTSGDGYYVYLDASKVDDAKLFSPVINVPSQGACLSFWYHMHGEDVKYLTLGYYELTSGTENEDLLARNKTLWTMRGDQGDKWKQQNISLPTANEKALGFEAHRGYFPRGDIAIDDIHIRLDDMCEKDGTSTITSTPASSTKTTSTTTASTTTEKPKLRTPHLLVIGKVDPALEYSRVEMDCEGPEKDVEYVWHSRNPESDAKVVGSTQKKLIFHAIKMSDAGIYWCEVTKSGHETSDISNEVSVNVVHDGRAVPELRTEGLTEAEPAQVNQEIVLICGYEVKGAIYHWKTTSPAFQDSGLPDQRVLFLTTRPEHSGSYSCKVTKDGYSTASSIPFDLHVTSGRRCVSDASCNTTAYNPRCIEMRCECSSDAVLQDNSCELRPLQPNIYTSPGFLEFAIEETFYVICEAQVPVPSSVTYHFRKDGVLISDENVAQTSNVLKMTVAGEENSGTYDCVVNHRNIDSFHSRSISVKVKDFANLNCDFAKDLCGWATETDPAYVSFSKSTSTNNGDQDSSPDGRYIQVENQKTDGTLRAMLKSQKLRRTSLDSCLTLWYRMEGPDVYSLTVWTYTFSASWQENKGERLWTTVGTKGPKWIRERITIPAGEEFYIAIEALGTVALDDIVFTYRGAC